MRGLLQNKWFVGLMLIAGAVLVYTNIVDPLMQNSRQMSTSTLNAISQKVPFINTVQPPKQQKKVNGQEQKTNWQVLEDRVAARNPFMKSDSFWQGSDSVKWPRVSAIVFGQSGKFALINGNVVSEGEEIAGYKVLKILVDSVRIRYAHIERDIVVFGKGSN